MVGEEGTLVGEDTVDLTGEGGWDVVVGICLCAKLDRAGDTFMVEMGGAELVTVLTELTDEKGREEPGEGSGRR